MELKSSLDVHPLAYLRSFNRTFMELKLLDNCMGSGTTAMF